MKAELQFDVEKLTREVVEAAMAEALSRHGGVIVQEIVKKAITEKADNYSKETILQAALKKAIVGVAKDRIANWLQTHLEEISRMVDERVRKELTPEFVTGNVMAALKAIKLSGTPFWVVEETYPEDEEA